MVDQKRMTTSFLLYTMPIDHGQIRVQSRFEIEREKKTIICDRTHSNSFTLPIGNVDIRQQFTLKKKFRSNSWIQRILPRIKCQNLANFHVFLLSLSRCRSIFKVDVQINKFADFSEKFRIILCNFLYEYVPYRLFNPVFTRRFKYLLIGPTLIS